MKKSKIQLTIIILFILICLMQMNAKGQESVSLIYLYGNESFKALKERNLEAINTVAPSYFDLDEKGNLLLNSVNKEMIQELHTKHIKVTPFLSNHWNREKGRLALKNQESLIRSIKEAIFRYGFDGINIDIENLNEEDQESYITFIKSIRQALPQDKIVSVAVAANPNGIKVGWQGSYDYQRLSKYSNYLVVMAYDEHYEGGEEGTVASISFFDKSIQYALSKVENQKIVVGVPFYGRYWKTGETYGGYGTTTKKIEELKRNNSFIEKYDEKTKSMITKIDITYDTINGREFTQGKYIFYHENRASMIEKVNLAKQYHLGGIAAWSLGQETAEIWEAYSSFLNNETRKIENSEDAKWAEDAINFVKEKGWMQGRTDNQFMPNEKITRAEFVTVIARFLQLNVSNQVEDIYTDVTNHWAKNYILVVSKTGLVNGYENNLFKPNQYITREEIAKVLDGLIPNNNSQKEVTFRDVSVSSWSYSAIQKVVKSGIFIGYEDGTFCPKQAISRAEVATIMQRIAKMR